MSYNDLKVAPGRRRIDVVDITLERCANVYADGVCTASLENLFLYSETLDSLGGTGWAGDGVDIIAGAPTLPTGATDAVKLESTSTVLGTGAVEAGVCGQLLTSGHAFTIVASACAAELDELHLGFDNGAYIIFNLTSGTMTSSAGAIFGSITADGTGWWRCSAKQILVFGSPTAPYIGYAHTAGTAIGDGIYVSKVQLIDDTNPTLVYVKTTDYERRAPSPAATPCHQGWATCQDTPNYVAEDFVVSLCTPDSVIPDGCIPLIEKVEGDSGQLDPENSLGKRGQITLTAMDAPHDDVGIDPYVTSRDYDPMSQGTFWPKLRARFPYYQGRLLEWYQGYYPFDRANAKKRTYIIESLRGWGRTKSIQIVAKDPLKLADDKRAQWPRASKGTLAAAMTAVATPTTIDIETDDDTEYDLEDYESVSAVCIGSECIQYTGTTPITGGVRLTGVSRGDIGQYKTVAAAHAEGDLVQKCAYFFEMKAPKIFQILLERGADVNPAYITYATWETEYDEWWGGMLLTRLIPKPEGVTSSIKELIPQSGTWGLWFDNEDAEIKYSVVRPLDYDEIIATMTEGENIVAGSVMALDDDDRLTNQVLVQFGQVDPTKSPDDGTNYARGFLSSDPFSQSPNEHGQIFAQKINARWHPEGNRTYLISVFDRYIQARSDVPVRVEFTVDRKDDDTKTAQFVTLESAAIADRFGLPDPTVVRIIQQDAGGDTIKYIARQELLATGFARWAPDTYAEGYSYTDATAEEKRRYMFWADDATGLLGGIDQGKKWL